MYKAGSFIYGKIRDAFQNTYSRERNTNRDRVFTNRVDQFLFRVPFSLRYPVSSARVCGGQVFCHYCGLPLVFACLQHYQVPHVPRLLYKTVQHYRAREVLYKTSPSSCKLFSVAEDKCTRSYQQVCAIDCVNSTM